MSNSFVFIKLAAVRKFEEHVLQFSASLNKWIGLRQKGVSSREKNLAELKRFCRFRHYLIGMVSRVF
jgi:hypothetical protein